jgi:endonuclease/exonuclease/phosphatase family metal-dependent hydrolase
MPAPDTPVATPGAAPERSATADPSAAASAPTRAALGGPRESGPAVLLDRPGTEDDGLRRSIAEVLDGSLRRRTLDATTLRCATINTHRGQGPKVDYLRRSASPEEAERLDLLDSTKAYAYYIADWINRNRGLFDVVALQEVFNGFLGFGERLLGRYPQHDYYRVFSGYPTAAAHGVGFAGFRYENLLLARLERAPLPGVRLRLPGRVFFLAACGFTLEPFLVAGRIVWIGNTHLHAYDPRARTRQAAAIASTVASLGDAPVLLLGDLNTVPPGCKDGDFPAGDRDRTSYRDCGALRVLREAGLAMVEHRDEEGFHTYPTGAPNRTLDYILHSRHFEPVSYRVAREFRLSDHYPVVGEFRLEA